MARAGIFGKLTALGDFVRTGLPAGFLEVWDPWLQESLQAGRALLGEDGWLRAYERAPIWRFHLAAGVAGEAALAGLMMPSQDRVGRLFPLTLVWAAPSGPPLAHLTDAGVFPQAEQAMLSTLEPGTDLEALRTDLPDIPEHAAGPGKVLPEGVYRTDGDIAATVAARTVSRLADPASHWLTMGEDSVLLVALGLPSARSAATLFDLELGRWQVREAA